MDRSELRGQFNDDAAAGQLQVESIRGIQRPPIAGAGGREHLRGLRGPVLVVSNHVTYLDIAWILPALPARLRNRLATAMGGERLARMRRPSREMSLFERFLERLRYYLASGLVNVFPLPQKSGFLAPVWLA